MIQYKLLKQFPDLFHGFSTRLNGYSQGVFAGLNLGLSTADDSVIVQKNRREFFMQLNAPQEQLAIPKQIHSANIRTVEIPGVFEACDALITRRRGIYLTIQTADCFPVFLFDPVLQTCALVHSGWRGTAANIVGKTVAKLSGEFNAQPRDLFAVIGPGIQKACYQVDKDTADHFAKDFLQADSPGHFLLDVQGVILRQLNEAGLHTSHIEIDGRCTHCESRLFYSYRRDGEQSGRMMGVIGFRVDNKTRSNR